MEDELETTQLKKVTSETLPSCRVRKLRVIRKAKGRALLKRKIKGLERDDTVPHLTRLTRGPEDSGKTHQNL